MIDLKTLAAIASKISTHNGTTALARIAICIVAVNSQQLVSDVEKMNLKLSEMAYITQEHELRITALETHSNYTLPRTKP